MKNLLFTLCVAVIFSSCASTPLERTISKVDTLEASAYKVDHIVTQLALGNNFENYISEVGVIRQIDSIRFIKKGKELVALKKQLPAAVKELQRQDDHLDKINVQLLAQLDSHHIFIIKNSKAILSNGILYMQPY